MKVQELNLGTVNVGDQLVLTSSEGKFTFLVTALLPSGSKTWLRGEITREGSLQGPIRTPFTLYGAADRDDIYLGCLRVRAGLFVGHADWTVGILSHLEHIPAQLPLEACDDYDARSA